MTRQRIHDLVDLVIDFNEKADRLDEHDTRVSIEVDGRYDTGHVWIYTGIDTPEERSYSYVFDRNRAAAGTSVYDPDYAEAEAHITALIAIMEAGNDAR